REEHDREVDRQRYGYPEHIQGLLDHALTLEAEHDHDGKQQCDERDRRNLRHEHTVVPLVALDRQQHYTAENARGERNTEVDHDAPEDLTDADIDDGALEPEQRWQHRDEQPRVQPEGQDLEYTVQRDQPRGVFTVSARELVPHEHHRDAAGDADEYEAYHVVAPP